MSMKRPSVPRAVERSLWAESAGYCLNPKCRKNLTGSHGAHEIAHIIPHSDGGSLDHDNLILLCRNCHGEIDNAREQRNVVNDMRSWKTNAPSNELQHQADKFSSFEALSNAVIPLLNENKIIFDSYGPNSDNPENYALWVKCENTLIANNQRISTLLENNIDLFAYANQEEVLQFQAHAKEFKMTRLDDIKIRSILYPRKFAAIFGVESDDVQKTVSLSALQNYIRILYSRGYTVALSIAPIPTLKLRKGASVEELPLDNGPHLHQVFYSSGAYSRESSTKVTFRVLEFYNDWFDTNGIQWRFIDPQNLTHLAIKGCTSKEYNIKLYYEYCLTEAELALDAPQRSWVAVNTHHWGQGISDAAIDYARDIGCQAFDQPSFFRFCHNNLR